MKHFLLHAPLSQTRAQEILNAYGATPERWPEEERQALVELLAQSPELQTIQKTAIELDNLLDAWQPQTAPDTDTLIRSLPAQTRPKKSWHDQLTAFFLPKPMSWRQGFLAGAPLLLGFIWGVSGDPSTLDWSETEFLILNPPMEVLIDE